MEKPNNENNNGFNWSRFFQFALPYAFIMAIFNPEWGVATIFISAAIFSLVINLIMDPSPPMENPDEVEMRGGERPKELFIGHYGQKKLLTWGLSVMGLGLFLLMGSLSLFIDLIDPQGAENFNKSLHVGFFYGLSVFFWCHIRNLETYALIKDDSVYINQVFLIWGKQISEISFSEIESIDISFAGSVILKTKDSKEYRFGAVMGLDLSHYSEFKIPDEKILNPNFKSSYQLKHFFEAQKLKSKKDTQTSEQMAA